MTPYRTEELRRELAAMGVRTGDVLIVHSSMKSLGRVQGGPQTVIRALQRAVGPRGTVLMPAFSFNFEKVYAPTDPYDPARSPSKVGLISDTFRRLKGVRRSLHPTHSVAAWGRGAAELLEGHELLSGLAAETPFHRAARRGAKLLMVGCGFTALSLLHVAEELGGAPYLRIFNWGYHGWKPTALVRRGAGVARVQDASVPGCSRNFGAAEALARRKGLLREGRLGQATVLIAEAQAVLELAAREVRRRPDFLLCEPGACRACDERRVVFEMKASPDAAFLGEFMIDVVDRAGIRLAGGAGEERATQMIAERMESLGLANVRIERPPIRAWEPGFSRLEVRVNGRWETVRSAPASHAPATRGAPVSGRAVRLEVRSEAAKARAQGDIAVLWDGYGESAAELARLMKSGFKAFIYVDKRFDHGEIVAVGVPAQWTARLTTPMVSLPFTEAMRLFGGGPVECRLSVGGRVRPGRSSVVTGDLPGSGGGLLLVGAHHDTVFNSPAPDDDLCGVAGGLLLAKKLRGARGLRHTLRICSFGAEEQLSEGARWYAFESGLARDVRFVVQNDGIGVRAGTTLARVTGATLLADWLRDRARRSPLQVKVVEEVSPFSDHFPFNCLGAPSVWFTRCSTTAGRTHHHGVRDGFAEISLTRVAELMEFQAKLLLDLARAERWPFPTDFSPALRREMAVLRHEWFGAG
jgi:aminoglycoside 3-N-acetyltransferase